MHEYSSDQLLRDRFAVEVRRVDLLREEERAARAAFGAAAAAAVLARPRLVAFFAAVASASFLPAFFVAAAVVFDAGARLRAFGAARSFPRAAASASHRLARSSSSKNCACSTIVHGMPGLLGIIGVPPAASSCCSERHTAPQRQATSASGMPVRRVARNGRGARAGRRQRRARVRSCSAGTQLLSVRTRRGRGCTRRSVCPLQRPLRWTQDAEAARRGVSGRRGGRRYPTRLRVAARMPPCATQLVSTGPVDHTQWPPNIAFVRSLAGSVTPNAAAAMSHIASNAARFCAGDAFTLSGRPHAPSPPDLLFAFGMSTMPRC